MIFRRVLKRRSRIKIRTLSQICFYMIYVLFQNIKKKIYAIGV